MTHLNVHQQRIAFASSFTIANDNSGGHNFWYDRRFGSMFTVPDGWAFVVTDIIVAVSPAQGEGIRDPDRFLLTVVNFDNQGSRSFVARFASDDTRHYPLSGAYVVPGGHAPTFRNTTFSTAHAEAKILGYFVEGAALGIGQPVMTDGAPSPATSPEGSDIVDVPWLPAQG